MKANKEAQLKNNKLYIKIVVTDGTKKNGNKNRTRLSTNISVPEIYWDKDIRSFRTPTNRELIAFDGELVDEIKSDKDFNERYNFVKKLIRDNKGSIGFTVVKVRELYEQMFNPNTIVDEVPEEYYFLDEMKLYIDEKYPFVKDKKNETRICKYKTYNCIKEVFQKHKIKPTIEQMNLKHWDMIVKYCQLKGNENTTINNHRKEIRTTMNHFRKYDMIDSNFIEKSDKLYAPNKHYPVLKEDEIERVKALIITDDKLKKYHLVMMFHIETGLRIGDIESFDSQNINREEGIIDLYLSKNKSRVVIPLPKYVMDLLENNDFILPKVNDTVYNRKIKKICEIAKIDSTHKSVKFFGNRVEESLHQKCNIFTSHDVRRTMITRSLKKGIQPSMLMKITGHKDLKSFYKYVQFDSDDAVEAFRAIQTD